MRHRVTIMLSNIPSNATADDVHKHVTEALDEQAKRCHQRKGKLVGMYVRSMTVSTPTPPRKHHCEACKAMWEQAHQ